MIGHGTGYVPSPTRDVRDWFIKLRSFEPNFTDRVFVDIGCGEGVVLMRWSMLLKGTRRVQHRVGIESDTNLTVKAAVYLKRSGFDCELWNQDATTFDYKQLNAPLLCWLFNPFDTDSVVRWSDAVNGIDTEVIANNPEHVQALLDKGWLLRTSMVREWPFNSWFMLWNGVFHD